MFLTAMDTEVMVASRASVDQIIKVLLKHLERKKALQIARDLHNRVEGSKSLTETLARVAESLAHMED